MNEPETLERLLERYSNSNISGNPEPSEKILERYSNSNISGNPSTSGSSSGEMSQRFDNKRQKVIQRLYEEAINEIPLDNNEEDNLKTEENEIEEDEEDEMIKILLERKRQRILRNKIERKKMK